MPKTRSNDELVQRVKQLRTTLIAKHSKLAGRKDPCAEKSDNR